MEGRSVDQIAVEPIGELAVVDAAAERTPDIAERDLGLQSLFGVAQQETFAEIVERSAPLQAEIRGGDRTAGDAGAEVDAVEQRLSVSRAVARSVELLHHAER